MATWDVVTIILTVVMMGVMVIPVVNMSRGIVLAKRSQKWPTATAVITRSEVVRKAGYSTKGGRRMAYHPLVEYQFRTPAGELYGGSTVRFVEVFLGNRETSASVYCMQHPVGSSHPVAYDPAQPGRNVLEPGGNIAGAIVFTLFIVGLMIMLSLRYLGGYIGLG
jgi:hypothetical protein